MRTLWLLGSFLLTFSWAQPSVSPIPTFKSLYDVKVVQAFDIDTLKPLWKKRILDMKANGETPLIDGDSSFNTAKFNPIAYAKEMDALHVALIAFSPQVDKNSYEKFNRTWNDAAHALTEIDPYRYVPVTAVGDEPVWTKEPLDFAKESTTRAIQEHYPLLGSFVFERYALTANVTKAQTPREGIHLPIESPAAHVLFQFSEKTHIPFQIHYEIEDALLPKLEKMFQTYPKARVIWTNFGQTRYPEEAKHYSVAYVQELIERYPNLRFNLAIGEWNNPRTSILWDPKTQTLKPEWVRFIEEHPYRFLMALHIGNDKHESLKERVSAARAFLKNFSPNVQEIIAYKAFWRWVFMEEFR